MLLNTLIVDHPKTRRDCIIIYSYEAENRNIYHPTALVDHVSSIREKRYLLLKKRIYLFLNYYTYFKTYLTIMFTFSAYFPPRLKSKIKVNNSPPLIKFTNTNMNAYLSANISYY